jgi:hypothetical protein
MILKKLTAIVVIGSAVPSGLAFTTCANPALKRRLLSIVHSGREAHSDAPEYGESNLKERIRNFITFVAQTIL